ncbi:unnamed protein product, partial [Ectocarpus fasciculatus]
QILLRCTPPYSRSFCIRALASGTHGAGRLSLRRGFPASERCQRVALRRIALPATADIMLAARTPAAAPGLDYGAGGQG